MLCHGQNWKYNTIQYIICKAPCCRGFRGANVSQGRHKRTSDGYVKCLLKRRCLNAGFRSMLADRQTIRTDTLITILRSRCRSGVIAAPASTDTCQHRLSIPVFTFFLLSFILMFLVFRCRASFTPALERM